VTGLALPVITTLLGLAPFSFVHIHVKTRFLEQGNFSYEKDIECGKYHVTHIMLLITLFVSGLQFPYL
jgi:hypothetical protein